MTTTVKGVTARKRYRCESTQYERHMIAPGHRYLRHVVSWVVHDRLARRQLRRATRGFADQPREHFGGQLARLASVQVSVSCL